MTAIFKVLSGHVIISEDKEDPNHILAPLFDLKDKRGLFKSYFFSFYGQVLS